MAHDDATAGTHNRRILLDRIEQAIARSRRHGKYTAVCHLGLGSLKAVRDSLGHDGCDRFLAQAAERLLAALRAEDTLVRLGGGEFALLFTDLEHKAACDRILDRVLAAAQSAAWMDAAPACIAASLGVTFHPGDAADADTLMRHADQAMRRAEEAGGNRHHRFDPDHDGQVRTERHYQQRLREALERDEFELFFQPKVNLATGDVIGAEALMRWRHPEMGLLLPGDFVNYLHGSALASAIGEWAIDSALRQSEAWQAQGLHFTVSTNISADHLLQADFPERLAQKLQRHPQLPPGTLELEILETVALADIPQAVQVLNRCRQLGVKFALDDFGTGYSSLSYYRNLPVDVLKIDQSFVRGMLSDPDDLGIVESVVRLANASNRPAIAEGVETLEQGAMLVHLGCPLAQGYAIAKPMPGERMPAWIDRWHAEAVWRTLERQLADHGDLILHVAAESHRLWIDRIVRHLDDPSDEMALDLHSDHCRFWRWYRSSGTAIYGALAEFKAIAAVHENVHTLAAEIVGMARKGQAAAARQGLPTLYAGRDSLLQLLHALRKNVTGLHCGAQPTPPRAEFQRSVALRA